MAEHDDFPKLSGDSPAEQLVAIRFAWYSSQARYARWAYRGIGVLQLLAALAIALSVAFDAPTWFAPGLGGLIALAEGVRTLLGLQDSYPMYRRTAEELRNEAWLFAQQAGRYADAEDRPQLLAERVVEISSAETEQWVNSFGQGKS
ncbi:hypothetical protein GCM10009789_56610 [Kribbella sancticallisti]|uniref:DUF4231 domain-containing protein n=1 Tax=Kribbella sancticallisti TaxID=460087 RepID=A0ABN2E513_9ACTN